MISKMKINFTSTGIAALWLRGHAPNSEEREIKSLSELIEGIWADGVKAGTSHAIVVVNASPTTSAAIATLEADVFEIKKDQAKEEMLDIEITAYRDVCSFLD